MPQNKIPIRSSATPTCSRRWGPSRGCASCNCCCRRIPRDWWSATLASELDIPSSTLSHHLDKLKNEDLVKVRREGTFLWYTANTEALQELLGFLYAECCTRNKAVKPENIITLCK